MDHGIHVAIVTPIKNGQIDKESFLKHITYLEKDPKCKGIVLFGSTGEGSSMTLDQKVVIMNALATKKTKLQVTIGIGGICTQDIIDCAIISKKYFPNAIMMLSPPPYVKASQNSITRHFSEIIGNDRLATTKFMLYNIPSRTGVTISVETIVLLKYAFGDRIVAIKDATGNVVELCKLKSHDITIDVFCGDDNLYPAMKALGAVGLVSVYGNYSCKELAVTDRTYYNAMLQKRIAWVGLENPRMIKHLLGYKKIIDNNDLLPPLAYGDDDVTNDVKELFTL